VAKLAKRLSKIFWQEVVALKRAVLVVMSGSAISQWVHLCYVGKCHIKHI